jgi:hypothetical protein
MIVINKVFINFVADLISVMITMIKRNIRLYYDS